MATSMEAKLDDIIAKAAGMTPLRRRRARETLRLVYPPVDGFIVKEFDIPAECRRYRKPWLKEIAGLKRLGDDYDGAAAGVVERTEGGVRKVFLVRRFIDGAGIDAFSVADMPAMAALLADIHARGVVTDDANIGNFIRTPSGGFAFIDFGRAIVFRRGHASFIAVGRELAKLYREGFNFDKDLMEAFLADYFAAAKASRARRALIIAVCRATLALRALRKGKGR